MGQGHRYGARDYRMNDVRSRLLAYCVDCRNAAIRSLSGTSGHGADIANRSFLTHCDNSQPVLANKFQFLANANDVIYQQV